MAHPIGKAVSDLTGRGWKRYSPRAARLETVLSEDGPARTRPVRLGFPDSYLGLDRTDEGIVARFAEPRVEMGEDGRLTYAAKAVTSHEIRDWLTGLDRARMADGERHPQLLRQEADTARQLRDILQQFDNMVDYLHHPVRHTLGLKS